MGRRRLAVGLLALVGLVLAVHVAPVVGQSAGTVEPAVGGDEGGLEGATAAVVERHGPVGAVAVLLVGVGLLTACVERLISYLVRAALGLRLSLFALAIVFTGFEFDDTVLGVVLSTGGLEGAALGTALGTAVAIIGVTLALAALVSPFPVDLPRDYLVLFWLAPLVLVPFALVGTLTRVHGVVLVCLSLLLFGYVLLRERQRNVPVFRGSELGESVRPDGGVTLPDSVPAIPEDRFVRGRTDAGILWLGLAGCSLGGIVLASMLIEAGSAAAIDSLGIEQTVFGATVLTAILTFEDVMLTLEPVRRGVPEIGVGNVIGSVVFSVTGNVGVILLVSDLTLSAAVWWFHLPVLVGMTTLAAVFLAHGRLRRRHGVVLGGCYVGYWIVALWVFGAVPLGG
jgi:cation:H+ antiporter